MSDRFQFSYLNAVEAAKLLEAFRLYGTKDDLYTVRNLWLVYAVTDAHKSFYFTRAYYHAQDSGVDAPITVEYVFSCGDKLSLVRCTKRGISEDLCILAVQGENPFTQNQLAEMVIFYEEHDHPYIYEHKSRWIDWQHLNVVRMRKLMMRNPESWSFDLLAKEYNFRLLGQTHRSVLWDCICKYGNSFNDHKQANLRYALTDAQQSFRLTFCYYMSDGIKHCNEPNDYEYAIVTDGTAGVVHVWFQNGVQIKKIKGEIPWTEQKLCEAVAFYQTFHGHWESVYTKMHGRIPPVGT